MRAFAPTAFRNSGIDYAAGWLDLPDSLAHALNSQLVVFFDQPVQDAAVRQSLITPVVSAAVASAVSAAVPPAVTAALGLVSLGDFLCWAGPIRFMTPGSALPAASATYRGVCVFQPGAAEAADTVVCCMKTAADTYTWTVVATAA